jgi:hypothetical protein
MKKSAAQKKFLFITVIAVTIGSIVTILAWSIQDPSPTASSDENLALCPTMTDNLSKSKSLKFHPIKIVAEPWRGEHHVYAIFALPLKYQNIYDHSQLLVKDTDTPWLITPTDGLKYGEIAPDDSFLVVGFFPTRLTLWYWVSWRFGELKQPCNWTLHLFPK